MMGIFDAENTPNHWISQGLPLPRAMFPTTNDPENWPFFRKSVGFFSFLRSLARLRNSTYPNPLDPICWSVPLKFGTKQQEKNSRTKLKENMKNPATFKPDNCLFFTPEQSLPNANSCRVKGTCCTTLHCKEMGLGNMCMCISIYVYLYRYVYPYVCTHTHTCVCVWCVYVCVCVCKYIFPIYVFIVYVCVHIYI